MIVSKTLAVLAAILLIGALIIGTLGPEAMSLKDGLTLASRTSLDAAERFVRSNLSSWLWDKPLAALFVRPLWLIPAALGIICAGAATTAATKSAANNTRRRRS